MILLLMISIGLIGANSLVLSPIAADVARGLGVDSAATVMMASAIYGGCVALSALFLAPRADRVGPHKALKTALAVVFFGLACSSVAPSLTILSLSQGLAGIGAGMAIPAIYSLAAVIAPKGQEARTMGLVLTGWTLSMVGGVTLSAYVAEYFGWRAVFILLTLGIAVIFGVIWKKEFPVVQTSDRVTSPLSALKVPGIVPALFSVLVLGSGFYGIYNYLGAHLTSALARDVSDAGWLTLAYGLGFGAAMLIDPWLDKVGPRRGLLAVFCSLALYYSAMTLWSQHYGALIALMAGWGVLQHLGLNLTVSRLSVLDPSQRGAVMGLNSAIMYASVFGATMIFRPIYETGGLAWCMGGAALLAVLGAAEALSARIKAQKQAVVS